MCSKWSNWHPQVLSARNWVCQDIFSIVFVPTSRSTDALEDRKWRNLCVWLLWSFRVAQTPQRSNARRVRSFCHNLQRKIQTDVESFTFIYKVCRREIQFSGHFLYRFHSNWQTSSYGRHLVVVVTYLRKRTRNCYPSAPYRYAYIN